MIMRSVKKSVAVAVLAGLLMTMFITVVPMLASAAQDYGIENSQLEAFEGWKAEDLEKIASENVVLSFDIGRKPSVTSGTVKFAPTKSLLITAAAEGTVSFSNYNGANGVGDLATATFTNRYDETKKTFSIPAPGTTAFEGFCIWINTNMLGADAANCAVKFVLYDNAGHSAVMKNKDGYNLGSVADGGDYVYFKFADFDATGFDPLGFTKMDVTITGMKAEQQLLISDLRLFNFTPSYLETMAKVNALYTAEEYEEDAYEAYTTAYEAYVKEVLNGKKSSVNTKQAALDEAIKHLADPQLKIYDIKGFGAYKTEDIDEMYEQLYCNASLISNGHTSDFIYDFDDVENVYDLEYNTTTKAWERVAGPNASMKLLKLVCTEVEGWMQFFNFDREEKLEDGQPIPINNNFFGKDMSGYTGIRFYMNFSNIPESRAKSFDVVIGTYGEEPNQTFTAHVSDVKETGYYLIPFSSFDNQDKLPQYLDKLDTFGIKFNDITNGVEVAITDVKAYIIVDTKARKANLVNLIDEIENEYEESFWSRQSWANLIAQKNAALKVAGKKDVSQAEIDAAYDKLTAAVNNLKKPQYAVLRFPGFSSWTPEQLAKMVTNGGTFSLTHDQTYLPKDDAGKPVTDTGLLIGYKSGSIQLFSYTNDNSDKQAEYQRLEAVTTPFGGRNCTGYDGIRMYLYMPKGGTPTRMTMTIGNCNAFMPLVNATCTVDTSEMTDNGYVYFPFSEFVVNKPDYEIDYEFLDYFAFTIQGSYLVQDAFYCVSDIAAYKILDDEGNPLEGDLPGSKAPISVLPIIAVSILAFAICMLVSVKKASRVGR